MGGKAKKNTSGMQGEINARIQEICQRDWRSLRATALEAYWKMDFFLHLWKKMAL